MGGNHYIKLWTDGNHESSERIPLVIGASSTDPEMVSNSGLEGASGKSVVYEKVQAIKLDQAACQQGHECYAWQANPQHFTAQDEQDPNSNALSIVLTKQTADAKIEITPVVTGKSASQPAAYPANATFSVSNDDQSETVQQDVLAQKVVSIANLLPEQTTLNISDAYYNDPVNGEFYNYVVTDKSREVDLSSSDSDAVRKVTVNYAGSSVSSQKYTLKYNLPKELGKDDIKAYNLKMIDVTNLAIPATSNALEKFDNDTVYGRASDQYAGVLAQSNDADSSLDPDNSTTIEIKNKLYRSNVIMDNGNHTITVSLIPYQPRFMPYYDIASDPSLSNAPQGDNDGITAAFITDDQDDSCHATVNGSELTFVDSKAQMDYPHAIKKYGKNFYISFGGENGSMLAEDCSTEDLVKEYDRVYNEFTNKVNNSKNFKGFDFDIEGGAISNTNLNQVLPAALKIFHQQHPDAEIWLTLATMPDGQAAGGIPQAGADLISNVANKGAGLTGINLMTMDYGNPNKFTEDMGRYAVEAGSSLVKYLQSNIYKNMSALKLNTMISNTPMIGQNDTGLIFRISDADTLESAAKSHKWGVRFWSANRDQPCSGSSVDLPKCSGRMSDTGEHSKGQYSEILDKISSGTGPNPPLPPQDKYSFNKIADQHIKDASNSSYPLDDVIESGYTSGGQCHDIKVSAGQSSYGSFTATAQSESPSDSSCHYTMLFQSSGTDLPSQGLTVTVTDPSVKGVTTSFSLIESSQPQPPKAGVITPNPIELSANKQSASFSYSVAKTSSDCSTVIASLAKDRANELSLPEKNLKGSFSDGVCKYTGNLTLSATTITKETAQLSITGGPAGSQVSTAPVDITATPPGPGPTGDFCTVNLSNGLTMNAQFAVKGAKIEANNKLLLPAPSTGDVWLDNTPLGTSDCNLITRCTAGANLNVAWPKGSQSCVVA